MKTTSFYILSFIFLTSFNCISQTEVKEIEDYIQSVDNNKEFSESITEYIIENKNGRIVGGEDIYNLTDNNGLSRRIRTEYSFEKIIEYLFYYENEKLIYAHFLELKEREIQELKLDTIKLKKFYFKSGKLIYQSGQNIDMLDQEKVKKKSDYYKQQLK